MKASDYIVEFLIQHKITDVFGYPGGMVTHLMDSLDKYGEAINAYINYHEQACAMAACGWAEVTGLPGVAYATSGPGATNLLTGIACAFFESLPCVFLTGQVNTYEQRGDLPVRQRGFQETDIVSMAAPITKMAAMVTKASELPEMLEKAFFMAMEGRRGPVLLDVPMDVFRGDIDKKNACKGTCFAQDYFDSKAIEPIASEILCEIQKAERPVILAGHGVSLSGMTAQFRRFVALTGIPVVTSMIAVDTIPSDSEYCFGMIGAYGLRWANYLINNSDCILALGSRLDCRQTGVNRNLFAPKARILRVDIDPGEMENRINAAERQYCVPLQRLFPALLCEAEKLDWNFCSWLDCCTSIRNKLAGVDLKEPGNLFLSELGKLFPGNTVITTDVGQNQVWAAQSLPVKEGQRVLFSGGHGAMGYSLPAAIGVAIAAKRPVIAIVGDGGLQMNLQELQFVVRENLPIKIVLLNNRALGMIHHFQEMYFDGNFAQTDGRKGFTVPDFIEIAKAYGIRSYRYSDEMDMVEILSDREPAFIEVTLPESTYVFPKLSVNEPIHMQEPPLDEKLVAEVENIFCDFSGSSGRE